MKARKNHRFTLHRKYTLAEIEHQAGAKTTFNEYHQLYSVVDMAGDFSQYDFAGKPDSLELVFVDGDLPRV